MIRTLSFAVALAAVSALSVSGRDSDEAAIRRTVQYYFDGGRTGDSLALRKAFHPDARMLFVREGKLAVVPIGDYIRRVAEGKPAAGTPDSTQRRIASLDVVGDAAVARLELVRPDMVVTDYMSLLRVEGQWVIVNKIFDRQATQGHAGK